MQVPLLLPVLMGIAFQQTGTAHGPGRSVGLALDSTSMEIPLRDDQKKALVIGNSAYPTSPLKNTQNDARAVSEALAALGFQVTNVSNTDLKTLRRVVGTYIDSLRKDDISFFYYAGHGIEIEGINYLVPVDFNAQRASDVPYEAYPLNQFMDGIDNQQASVNVVVLDACRNNPFTPAMRAFGKRGLAEVRAGAGSLIAFATSPGKTAGDGSGDNGVFTDSLVRFLRKPGVDIEAMFKEVSDDVARKTSREQIPWRSSSIVGKYFLAGQAPACEAGQELVDGRCGSGVRITTRSHLRYTHPPGGMFQMGCPTEGKACEPDEVPPREANVGSFWLGTTEVTVAAYQACVQAGGCNAPPRNDDTVKPTCNFYQPGRDNHPMNCVSWHEAQAFCRWDGGRLPTPEEWEYAAGGGRSLMHPWGAPAVDGTRANFCDRNCLTVLDPETREMFESRGWADKSQDDRFAATAPVGTYPAGANPWGALDLLGNLSEWTSGNYNKNAKEIRGGDWNTDPRTLRASNRHRAIPDYRSDVIGFRCAQ